MPSDDRPSVWASDTHLRLRRGDEQHAFRQIVRSAISCQATAVFLAGDVLDRQANRATVITFLQKQIGRLRKRGIPVFYLQGQHDRDETPWLSGCAGAHHLHRRAVTLGPHRIYGLDWLPKGELQSAMAEMPRDANLLVTHQVWADWMGDICSPEGEFAEVPASVETLYSGDLHQRMNEFRRNAGGREMRTISTGATTQQKVDEPSSHYFAKLYPNRGFRFCKLKSRVFLDSPALLDSSQLDAYVAGIPALLAAAAGEAVLRGLPAEISKPWVRVTFSSELPETVRRVSAALAGNAFVTWKELPPASALLARESPQAGDATTVFSMLPRIIDRDAHAAAFDLASLLLKAPNPEHAFVRWRQSQMEGK